MITEIVIENRFVDSLKSLRIVSTWLKNLCLQRVHVQGHERVVSRILRDQGERDLLKRNMGSTPEAQSRGAG